MVKTQQALQNTTGSANDVLAARRKQAQTQTDGNTLRWMQAHEQRPTGRVRI